MNRITLKVIECKSTTKIKNEEFHLSDMSISKSINEIQYNRRRVGKSFIQNKSTIKTVGFNEPNNNNNKFKVKQSIINKEERHIEELQVLINKIRPIEEHT